MLNSNKTVKMGELIITENPENLSLLGLGSCIGLVVYDTSCRLFAIAHTMLPEIQFHKERLGFVDPSVPARFTDEAVKRIVKAFKEKGLETRNLRAKIVGGAQIFDRDLIRVGEKNLASARNTLQNEGIKIENEVVGGNLGVSVIKIRKDGKIDVRKEGKIIQI